MVVIFGKEGTEREVSPMTEKDLGQNIAFVEQDKAALLAEHWNKFLLVHEGKLQQSFDTYEKAAEEGVRLFGLDGNFLVHHLIDKEKEVTNIVMSADI